MTNQNGLGSDGVIPQTAKKFDVGTTYAQTFISPSGIGMTANLFMAMFQIPALEITSDVEPITMTFGGDGESLAGQWFIASKSIRFFTDAANTFQQGGQQPGGQPQRKQKQDSPPPAPF